MTERVAAGAPATNFCSQCGARLPTDARFCAGCGCPVVASAVRPQPDVVPSPPAHAGRSLREQAPGLVVLTMFLAIGLALWVSVLRPGAPASSAPTRQPAPQTAAAGMPADHPPTTLPDEAKKFIASLLEKAQAAPADVSAWKTLAQVQSRAAEIDASYAPAAVDSYKHVLGIAPEDTDALRGLGNVYYDQQQFAAAAEQYEGYLRLKPDDASVRTDLATTYLYQRQLDRAVDTYKKVIATNPSFLQAHFNLGLAYEALGSRDKALESLATARTLAPDDATREQIDRVTAQLKGGGGARLAGGPPPIGGAQPAAGPAAPPSERRGPAPPPGDSPHAGARPGTAGASSAAASATDFHGAVEAGLRAHPILGPKITAIEWPAPQDARVSVADFPMQAMPEFARNLFRARLETVLDDAKTRFPAAGESSIEIVDAASGASMERVTH
jgi:tetratricopeptide (TPR) repeat protein